MNTCDKCHSAVTDTEAELGWPISDDDGLVCPDCYGPEAFCVTCGETLDAHSESSRCEECAQ